METNTTHHGKHLNEAMPIDYVLKITSCYHTMDMSVSNSGSNYYLYSLEKLSKGDTLKILEYPTIEVVEVGNENITLKWCGVIYDVTLDNEIETEWVLRNNPYLSVDEVRLKFYLSKQNLKEEAINLISKVGDIHEQYGTYNSGLYWNDQASGLWYLKRLIDKGFVSYYPLYAMYQSIKNWSTGELIDFDVFHSIMQEGIENGCLETDNALGWDYFGIVVEYNEHQTWKVLDTKLQFLVQKAATEGLEIAQDILKKYDTSVVQHKNELTTDDFVLKIRSCEDSLYMYDGNLGFKYNTYLYNLKELKDGLIIQNNDAYPPIEVVTANDKQITLRYDNTDYTIPFGKWEYTKEVSSNKNDGSTMSFSFHFAKQKDIN